VVQVSRNNSYVDQVSIKPRVHVSFNTLYETDKIRQGSQQPVVNPVIPMGDTVLPWIIKVYHIRTREEVEFCRRVYEGAKLVTKRNWSEVLLYFPLSH